MVSLDRCNESFDTFTVYLIDQVFTIKQDKNVVKVKYGITKGVNVSVKPE